MYDLLMIMFAESICFVLFLLYFQCFWDPDILFGLFFGASGLTWGPIGTLEGHGVSLGAFELQFSSPWGHLGSYLLDFGVSRMLKVVQNAPGMLSC